MASEERIFNELHELERELHELNDRQKKLEHYIINDKATGEPGAMKRIADIEERVKLIEDREKVRKVYKAMVLAIGGAIVWIIDQLAKIIPDIFKH